MRRPQKGGRGGHARAHPPWWETDKNQISPPTGGSELGGGGESSSNSAVASAGGAVSSADSVNASGPGVSVGPGSGSSGPRPQQSPGERTRRDGRYSHKVRGADQVAPDRRRNQIGRTPPPSNSRSVGLRGQAFSPSRVQTPTGASEASVHPSKLDKAKGPAPPEVVKMSFRQQLQHTARPNPAAVYGFVGWIGTLVGFLLYLLWAYLPVEILHNLGVTYYPSRYWAVAIPAYVCVVVLFIFTTYSGFCLMINPPPDAFSTFTDEHAMDKPKDWHVNSLDDSRLPPIFDIPIAEVNRLLYQRAPEQQQMRNKP